MTDYAPSVLGITHEQRPTVIPIQGGIAVLKSSVALKGLDFRTFQKLVYWEESGQRVAQWDWSEVREKYKSHPQRFEVSIWHSELFLCGACIDRPTWSGTKLRIDFIETNPLGSPLSGAIADIVILTGKIYAKAIGASQLRIMHPIYGHGLVESFADRLRAFAQAFVGSLPKRSQLGDGLRHPGP